MRKDLKYMENTVRNKCVSNLKISFAQVSLMVNVNTGLITDTDSLYIMKHFGNISNLWLGGDQRNSDKLTKSGESFRLIN